MRSFKSFATHMGAVLTVVLIASAANAGIITVTNDPTGTARAGFGGNDIMDWATLGPSFTQLSNPFNATSNGGLTMTVSQAGNGNFERRDLNIGWNGNFTDGPSLLWTQGSRGPLTILFASSISGVGFQINPNDADTATDVQLFTAANVSLGIFNLITNNRGQSSASFIGFTSSLADIARIVISQPAFEDFTINQLSLITGPTVVPLPAALPMFLTGLAGLGLMRRRKRQALRD